MEKSSNSKMLKYKILTKLSRNRKNCSISDFEKADLISDAKKMIAFFSRYCTEDTNFLPPNSISFSPKFIINNYATPTDIAFLLLSLISAADMNIIKPPELYKAALKVLTTIKRLEKFNGILYNSYSIIDLKPCSYIVKTDENGTFACSMVVFKEGLLDYEQEHSEFKTLREMAEEIIAEINLACLNDEFINLFHTEYDTKSKVFSSTHCSVLMSVSRLATYFGLAKKQIKPQNYTNLNCTGAVEKTNAGLLSENGTMLEYFLPALFMYCDEDSSENQSLQYCISCQQKAAILNNSPYGVSTSGIYDFDGDGNYKSAENPIPQTALNDVDFANVISPYSTYISLQFDTISAIANLGILKSLDIQGGYGLYEAIDYSKKRVGENLFALVECYSSCHLGMSIVGINNLINNSIMQKRFFRDAQMKSAKSYLLEKSRVVDVAIKEFVKQKPNNNIVDDEEYVGYLYPNSPHIKLLNNNKMTVSISDGGVSFIKSNGIDITKMTNDLLQNPKGTFAFIKLFDKVISLTYAPSYGNSAEYETSFSSGKANFYSQNKFIKSKIEVMLHRTLACEQRNISLENLTKKAINSSMIIYLEPIFASTNSKTKAIEVEYNTNCNIILINAVVDGKNITMGISFSNDGKNECEIETNRDKVLEDGYFKCVKQSSFASDFSIDKTKPTTCIAIKKQFSMSGKWNTHFKLLTVVADSNMNAINLILKLRDKKEISANNCAKNYFLQNSVEDLIAKVIIPQVLYFKRDTAVNSSAIANNSLGKIQLQTLGITGDLPIVLVEIINAKDMFRVSSYLKCYRLLARNFLYFDLIFLYSDNEDNSDLIADSINELVGDLILSTNENNQGKIRTINAVDISDEICNLLRAVACHIATRSMVRIETPLIPFKSIQILSVEAASHNIKNSAKTFHLIKNYISDINSDKEQVILKLEDIFYDLRQGANAENHPKYTKYYGEICDCKIETIVKITQRDKSNTKYIEFIIKNNYEKPQKVTLCYYIQPKLNGKRKESRLITGKFEHNSIILYNAYVQSELPFMGITAFDENFSFTCDRIDFLNGRFATNQLPPLRDFCVAISVEKIIDANKAISINFAISSAKSEDELISQLKFKPLL